MKSSAAACLVTVVAIASQSLGAPPTTPKFSVYEVALDATGSYQNPYTDLTAEVRLREPGGENLHIAQLFWDGGSSWRFRFAPPRTGDWTWSVRSSDPGLDGRSGRFTVTDSDRKGSIRAMSESPHHFERQDGTPFWFLGDTAWALFTDSRDERHDREAALKYIDARAGAGFNVLHSMLLSEAGWGNQGGPPFADIASERIDPRYWREVDLRLAYANRKGMVCGLALAWGDKRGREPYAWRRFPQLEARKRYARYIAARYSAYNVYFIVSGEWHAEIRARKGLPRGVVKEEFFEIGDALQAADPHHRMVAIHPMTAKGSVREFNDARWMAFGDYQQNYRDLHARVLESLRFRKPVVNSEYGYYLRDRDGDGTPDKDNSTSLEAMRYATWDIIMGGGYVVTGFGTTYFGGNRDPGPFDLRAEKNRQWEQQIGQVQRFFTSLRWWDFEPHDELLRSSVPRTKDRRELGRTVPPARTFWCLAIPGREYVIYTRGARQPVRLSVDGASGALTARQFNPRTGVYETVAAARRGDGIEYRPPDDEDWLVHLRSEDSR